MVQDIHEGNWLRFGSGKLRELCKLLPEENEVRASQLLSFHLRFVVKRLINKYHAIRTVVSSSVLPNYVINSELISV